MYVRIKQKLRHETRVYIKILVMYLVIHPSIHLVTHHFLATFNIFLISIIHYLRDNNGIGMQDEAVEFYLTSVQIRM